MDDLRKALGISLMEHYGYLQEECVGVLSAIADSDLEKGEEFALREMFMKVFSGDSTDFGDIDASAIEELRNEEFVVLESIFGSEYER